MAYISFQPHDYFNTKLFTANASTQSITGVGFQPDMVWGKSRGNAYDHEIYDAVRGVHKRIKPNQNHAEASDTGNLTSFDSDGFSLGSATNMNYTNGDNIVAWNWKASGSGSANTDGSINTTSTSVSTVSGFSISTYTGTGSNATVGHGLGVVPKVFMIKRLNDTGDWRMYTEMTGNESQLSLSQNSAADSGNTTMWNSTSPTSTTFAFGTHGNVNTSGGTYVAYCFAQKVGFSSFGKYIGTGSATSCPFIYTGFKPAFVIVKLSSGADNWMMFTNKIGSQTDETGGHNIHNRLIEANGSGAEQSAGTGHGLDFYANGFRVIEDNVNMNGSGSTYIYLAFAEESIVSSNGVPATAG
tara:strand:- start:87 stop:1154 length:1068 start_codon:yes stop_codon:yes gene_type:complete